MSCVAPALPAPEPPHPETPCPPFPTLKLEYYTNMGQMLFHIQFARTSDATSISAQTANYTPSNSTSV